MGSAVFPSNPRALLQVAANDDQFGELAALVSVNYHLS